MSETLVPPKSSPHSLLSELLARKNAQSNQRIVDDSDRVIAFVALDRTGGTEDTIRRAERAGKPVEVTGDQ